MSTVRARTPWLLATLAGVFGLIALFVLTASTPSASASRPDGPKPTVVLVHGAWADSSGWSEVIRRLQKKDYRVLAPANPLRSLAGDSDYLASYLAQEEGPIVLVGHSYGGAVITNAAAGNENVKALVYINGFVPDLGEDVLHLTGEGSLAPTSIEFKAIHVPPQGPTDFDVYIKAANFHETFAGDLSQKDAAVLAVTQRPIAVDAAAGRPSRPPGRASHPGTCSAARTGRSRLRRSGSWRAARARRPSRSTRRTSRWCRSPARWSN